MQKPPAPQPPGAELISKFLDQIETCLSSIRRDAQRLKEVDGDRTPR